MGQNLRGNRSQEYDASMLTATPKSKSPGRPWPITLGGLLIFLQGLAFLMLSGGAMALMANYRFLLEQFKSFIPPNELPPELLDPSRFMPALLIEATLGLTLALFLLLNSLRFLQRHPRAWLLAMVLQGVNLLTALLLYWRGSRGLIFIWMLSSLVIVFHLNRADVLNAFHLRAPEAEQLK